MLLENGSTSPAETWWTLLRAGSNPLVERWPMKSDDSRAAQLDEMNPSFQKLSLLSWTPHLLFACPQSCRGLRASQLNATARWVPRAANRLCFAPSLLEEVWVATAKPGG